MLAASPETRRLYNGSVSRLTAPVCPSGAAPCPARTRTIVALGIGLSLLLACEAKAQGTARRLTTIDALHEFASYFHLQSVVVRGEFVEHGEEFVLRGDDSDIRLLNPDTATRGPVEVRGQLFDVGRLDPGDPRLRSYAERRGPQDWPRPGTEVVLNVTAVMDAQLATVPSLRALSLEPWKFEGQTITVMGNFRGRNLFGDLPAAPGTSRDDFVLSSAEGAVWVTGRRPRGQGFDLDVERRLDTNKWLEVTAVVTRCNTLVCLRASAMALADPPAATVEDPAADGVVPPPPAEVVFSIPTDGQLEVASTTTVRVQFSKGVRENTVEGRVRVGYLGADAGDPPIAFTTSYDGATRALQINFNEPLAPFSTIIVELLEGITAFDGGPVLPWRLTFSVGNR